MATGMGTDRREGRAGDTNRRPLDVLVRAVVPLSGRLASGWVMHLRGATLAAVKELWKAAGAVVPNNAPGIATPPYAETGPTAPPPAPANRPRPCDAPVEARGSRSARGSSRCCSKAATPASFATHVAPSARHAEHVPNRPHAPCPCGSAVRPAALSNDRAPLFNLRKGSGGSPRHARGAPAGACAVARGAQARRVAAGRYPVEHIFRITRLAARGFTRGSVAERMALCSNSAISLGLNANG